MRGFDKFLAGWLVVLTIGVTILAARFIVLEDEIAVRRSSSNQRVAAWNERMKLDSIQRGVLPARIDSLKKEIIKLKAVQQSIFQVETSWLKQIPDIPAPLFVVLLILVVSVFTAMAKYIIRLHKEKSEAEQGFRREQQSMIQAYLPLLSEIKTMLSFLRGNK